MVAYAPALSCKLLPVSGHPNCTEAHRSAAQGVSAPRGEPRLVLRLAMFTSSAWRSLRATCSTIVHGFREQDG